MVYMPFRCVYYLPETYIDGRGGKYFKCSTHTMAVTSNCKTQEA